jgi:MerR family transcriptional regulator, heat shock protein HspR
MRDELQTPANTDVPMYSIGTVARMLSISVFTLRMYEREGLMISHKAESTHRLYSQSDIERLKCIRHAINEEKISIAGIRKIYSMIPCWDIVQCSPTHRKKCPAYAGHAQPCWTYDHKRNACASLDCRLCEVYKLSSDCDKIKSSITNLTRVE